GRAGQVLAVPRSVVRESGEAQRRGSETGRRRAWAERCTVQLVRRYAQAEGAGRRRHQGRRGSGRQRHAGLLRQRPHDQRRAALRRLQEDDRRGARAQKTLTLEQSAAAESSLTAADYSGSVHGLRCEALWLELRISRP